jgi:hypothetical protein
MNPTDIHNASNPLPQPGQTEPTASAPLYTEPFCCRVNEWGLPPGWIPQMRHERADLGPWGPAQMARWYFMLTQLNLRYAYRVDGTDYTGALVLRPRVPVAPATRLVEAPCLELCPTQTWGLNDGLEVYSVLDGADITRDGVGCYASWVSCIYHKDSGVRFSLQHEKGFHVIDTYTSCCHGARFPVYLESAYPGHSGKIHFAAIFPKFYEVRLPDESS